MRIVMASAMRPSSTVKVSVFETLSGDRNAGLIAAKTAISRIKSTKGPSSGADLMRRRVDVCVKSGHRRKGGEASADGLKGVKETVPVPAHLGAGRGGARPACLPQQYFWGGCRGWIWQGGGRRYC